MTLSSIESRAFPHLANDTIAVEFTPRGKIYGL